MSDKLTANQSLKPGQSITSLDGRFSLILQNDGNLVLYRPGGVAMWATGTTNQLVSDAIMQQDGNFVLYTPRGPVWNSQTQGNNYLLIQDDGNLVIYNAANQPQWETHTDGHISVQLSSFLGAGHYMDSNGSLFMDGTLKVTTRTRSVTMFGGFTGGVTVGAIDKDGVILEKADNSFGVDGTSIGRSDRTESWTANFSKESAKHAVQLFVIHYWNPKVDFGKLVKEGIKITGTILEAQKDSGTDIKLSDMIPVVIATAGLIV